MDRFHESIMSQHVKAIEYLHKDTPKDNFLYFLSNVYAKCIKYFLHTYMKKD
jgi:hypothetical protein